VKNPLCWTKYNFIPILRLISLVEMYLKDGHMEITIYLRREESIEFAEARQAAVEPSNERIGSHLRRLKQSMGIFKRLKAGLNIELKQFNYP